MREKLDRITEPFDPMHPPPSPVFEGVAAAIGWIALCVALAMIYAPLPLIVLVLLILLR